MAPPHKLFLLAIVFAIIVTATTVHGRHNGAKDIVHSSCEHASYPSLCVRTLSSYSGPTITNRRDLAQAAVKISLSHAQSAAKKLTVVRDSVGKKRQEKAALVDCVEMIGDSVDDLSRTLGVLKHLRISGGSPKEFRWQMSNAQTWASAALTDDDTCLDGFEEIDGDIKTEVKQWMTKVARVTSNALYMINQLDETRGKPHDVHL
ncbi:unnamed protein product [Arabidopsis halleri]